MMYQRAIRRSLFFVTALSLLIMTGALTRIAKAASNPKATFNKVTLYAGYNNYQIKFSNLSKSATLTCKSGNKKIATVSNKGLITPKAEGKTTVTVTIKQNKKTYTSKVQVIVLAPYVSITNIPQEIVEGLSYKLGVTTKGIKNPTLIWSTSDPEIAIVDSASGELIAQGVGTTKLTVKDSKSGKMDSITIKVKEYNPVKINYDFKKGIPANASGRGSAKIEAVKKDSYNTVYVTNRSQSWEGIQFNISKEITQGRRYRISADIMQTEKDRVNIDASIEIVKGGISSYDTIGNADATKNKWTRIEQEVVIGSYDKIYLYFQVPSDSKLSFYVKNIDIEDADIDVAEVLSYESLYKLADEYGFSLGAVISSDTLSLKGYRDMVKKHFNVLAAANEMKAYALLDQSASIKNAKSGDGMPRMRFTEADEIMQFAKINGIKMRGHTLVWKEFMNDWFFREGYENNGKYVSREVALKRLESYIKQVVTHFDEKYPGVIYAWDVVNEAVSSDIAYFNPYNSDEILFKDDDPFYNHIGADYVQKAFEYAKKYAADDCLLFYNDWGADFVARRDAICRLVKKVNAKEKLIEGIGMQSYQNLDENNLKSYPNRDQRSVIDAVNMYTELGLEVHITELNIENDNPSNFTVQGEYMYKFMELLKEINKDKKVISNVTIWGIFDLPHLKEGDYGYPRLKYSSILTEEFKPKPSFMGLYRSLKGK